VFGLKWIDVDWLGGTINIERRIVSQIVDSPKTDESYRQMVIDSSMLEVLKLWKQTSQLTENNDWIFASPASLGRLPWSYAQVYDYYKYASRDAGIGHVTTHVLRHTYRAWLDTVGTSMAVQQRMMRHADIKTTMSYGDVFSEEMQKAGTKISQLALNGLPVDCKAS
jgi:integrase